MRVALITIVTKSGEVLYKGIYNDTLFDFNKWLYDRVQHEYGMIPYGGVSSEKGVISIDCIARISCELD